MASRDRYRNQRDPSEAQLRVMLEARQHELEAHRQRTSRTFSIILLVVISGTAGAIWLFPAPPAQTAAAAVPLPAAKRAASAVDPELKMFTDTDPGDTTEDVRFAMQLLNFANPAAATSSPANQAPTSPQVEAAIKSIADPATAAP